MGNKARKLARRLRQELGTYSNNGELPSFLVSYPDIADSAQFTRVSESFNAPFGRDLTFSTDHLELDDIKKRNKRFSASVAQEIESRKQAPVKPVQQPTGNEPYRRNYIPEAPKRSSEPLAPGMRPRLRPEGPVGSLPEGTNLRDTRGAAGLRYGKDHGVTKSIAGGKIVDGKLNFE